MEFVHGSYIGIVIGLILTGCGLPVPEEVFIIAAGISSAHDVLDPTLAFASCMIGALVGDCLMYSIGRHFGRALLDKKGFFSLKPEREAQIEQMIDKHGLKVFFLARFLVGIRGPMYITVGILKVPFKQFLLIDAICALAVIGTFFGLSYMFGINMESWWPWIHRQQLRLTIVLGVVVVIGALVYWFYFRRRARRLLAGETPASPEDANRDSEDQSFEKNSHDDSGTNSRDAGQTLNKSNSPV